MNVRIRFADPANPIRYVKGSDLVPHPLNWRTHPTEQMDALKGVLAEVGIADALKAYQLPDGRYQLIDGHARAEVLPHQEIPILVLDVNEEEAKKLLASFDPVGDMAGMDAAKLDELTSQLEIQSPALQKMLDDLLASAEIEPEVPEPGGGGDEFDATPDEGPTRTQPGDLWIIGGKHRLLVGDCTDAANVTRLIGGDVLSLVVTSPPYNQQIDKFRPSGMHKEHDWVSKVERLAYADSMPEPDYQKWQRRLLDVWHAAMSAGASLFYNHKIRYRDKRVLSPVEWLPGPFNWRQEIVWSRPGSVTQNARMFLPSDERVYWLYKGDDFYFDDTTEHKTWSTVWSVALETNKEHAVAYPLELASRPIRACSRPGDVVADPFLGSGTTLIAAHRLGRICYGCELSPKFADVILKRAEAEGLAVEKG